MLVPLALISTVSAALSASPRSPLFFSVPIPISLSSLTTPWLESFHTALAVRVFHDVVGAELVASGPLLLGAGQRLELFASDSGIWLAYVLASLGWLAALLRERAASECIVAACLWSLAGWPGQLAATGIAAALLLAGAPTLARAWLHRELEKGT